MTEVSLASDNDTPLFLAVSRAARCLSCEQNWRDGIAEFLRELGEHTGASRVWMFEVVEATSSHYVTDFIFEWAARPDFSNIDDSSFRFKRVEIDNDEVRELYQARLNGKVLQHHRTEQTGFMLREFKYQGIHSMLTIPVMVEGQWWGILGVDDCDVPKNYPESYIAALEIAAVLLTNAILKERLQWEAGHDHLTGLYNRRALIDLIERDLLEAPDRGILIMIDIDYFKRVNDTHGHQAGDEVLKAFTTRLSGSLPVGARLARFGGEEFALWYPGNGPKARYLAECLRAELLSAPVVWRAHSIPLTASFGIAQIRVGSGPAPVSELFEHLFSRADDALFQAKARGRNQVVFAR